MEYIYAFDEFYEKNTNRIEILFKDNKLIRVYFAVSPVCKHLTAITKDQIMSNVKRDSTNEKIQDFCKPDQINRLFYEMIWLSKIRKWPFKFTMKRFLNLSYLSIFNAILIHIIVLFTWHREIK